MIEQLFVSNMSLAKDFVTLLKVVNYGLCSPLNGVMRR